jgi:hypothetical protein
MILNDDFRKFIRNDPVPIYVYIDQDGDQFTNASFNMSDAEPFRLASIEDVKAELGTGMDDTCQ